MLRFLVGDDVSGIVGGVAGMGDNSKAPRVFINIDGSVQSCRLFVYTVSIAC